MLLSSIVCALCLLKAKQITQNFSVLQQKCVMLGPQRTVLLFIK